MSWSAEYKKSINCDNPKGFSQRAHCQGRKKKMKEAKDHEVAMAQSQLKNIEDNVRKLKKKLGSKEKDIPAWMQDKISKTHHNMSAVGEYHEQRSDDPSYPIGKRIEPDAREREIIRKANRTEFDKSMDSLSNSIKKNTLKPKAPRNPLTLPMPEETIHEEGLRDWFGKSKSKDGKKGWVNVVTGDSCASDKPGEGIPKCVSSAKRASMSKKERLAAQRAKRRQDPGQQKKSGAAKPTMVKTDRKTKKEEIELLDAYGNTFATIQDIIKPEPMQATNCPRCGQNPCVCSPEYDIEAMTEAKDKKGKGSGEKDACYHKVKSRYSVWPSAYASGALVKCRKKGAANWGNKKEGYEFEFNQDYHKSLVEKCWVGYTQKGMKKKGDKMVPNCVPVSEETEIQEKVQRYNELGQTVAVTLRFRGKIFYLQLFFPTVKFPNRKEVEAQVQKIYPDAVVMMAVPATVDPTKPTIRVAEEVLPDGPAADKRNPQKPKRKTQGGDVRPGIAQRIKEQSVPYGARSQPLSIPMMGKDIDGKPMKMYGAAPFPTIDFEKRQRMRDLRLIKKQGEKTTQVAHFEPEGEAIDEQSVPVTAYNKGDYPKNAGAMTPKEIERANEGSANRIRKTIKLANSHEPEGEMVEGAAWTKKSGKNPSGGLNEKGRKSYERENPGSDLKAPSKKVGNKRRASFCARMKGMKKKLTSAKTANDPDSRINKSLRAWNC